ncbi:MULTISPECIES: phosphate-starvation-inducible PsiE family protein [unclassified Geodermatophilus]|uniref:phosphate-starvation-inducible PsiE family protein n=1 Tax=unclassified Geodermatophilus TaxID=2637632 RepID=UPI003EEC949E
MSPRRDDPEQRPPRSNLGQAGTRALEFAENVVYTGIALLLVVAALVLLALAGRTTWSVFTDFSQAPMLELLDVLLLVFIVVELLFAVRTTVEKRELVAEPFLVIGVIASIKEIVVLSVEAAGVVGRGAEFTDRIIEIAVLGVLVLLLGATSWLLRRKEREPDEGEGGESGRAREARG